MVLIPASKQSENLERVQKFHIAEPDKWRGLTSPLHYRVLLMVSIKSSAMLRCHVRATQGPPVSPPPTLHSSLWITSFTLLLSPLHLSSLIQWCPCLMTLTRWANTLYICFHSIGDRAQPAHSAGSTVVNFIIIFFFSYILTLILNARPRYSFFMELFCVSLWSQGKTRVVLQIVMILVQIPHTVT